MYEDIDLYTKSQLPFNTLREEGLKLLMQKAKEKNITLSEEKVAELWDKYMFSREEEAMQKAALMARTLTLSTEEVQNESNKAIDAQVASTDDALQAPSNEEVNLGSLMSFERCEEAFQEGCRRFLLTDNELRDARAFGVHGPPLGQDWVMTDDGVLDLVHWTEQPLVFLPFETAQYEDTSGVMWAMRRGAILDFNTSKIMISEIRERDTDEDEHAGAPNEAALFNEQGFDVPAIAEPQDEDTAMDQEMRDALNHDRFDSAAEELSVDEHGNVDIERTLNRYWTEQNSLHPAMRDGDMLEKFLDFNEEGEWGGEELDPTLDAEDQETLAQLSPTELAALMREQDEFESEQTQLHAREEVEEDVPAPPRKYPLPADSYMNANEIEMLPGYEFNVDPEIERKTELDTLRDLYRLSQLPAANISESISQAVRALNAVELSKPVLDKTRAPLPPAEAKYEQMRSEALLPAGGTSPDARPGVKEFVDDINYRALTGGLSRMDVNRIEDVDDFPRNLTRIIDIPSDLLLALKTVPWPKLHPEELDTFVRFFEVPLTFRDSPLNHNDATYAVEEELQKLDLENENLEEDFEGELEDK